jgi:hypothetical protein
MQSILQATCPCGEFHVLADGTTTFTCACGRVGVVDWVAEQKREAAGRIVPDAH